MVEVQRPVDLEDTLESSSGYGVDEHDTRHDHLFSSSSAPDESLRPKGECLFRDLRYDNYNN